MTAHRHFGLTSQRNVGRGRFDRSAGSRGAVTKNTSGAEIVRLPSGSIVAVPPLESPDLSQARLKEALLFALPIGFFLWGLFALAIWALFFNSH